MSRTAKKKPAPASARVPDKTPEDPEISFSPADFAEVQGMAMREAKQGNMQAVAIVERIWRRRRRTVTLDLPPVDDADGLAKAQAAVIAAAAAGQITPREGMAFAAMLDYRRRALDTVEFEERLREVERINAERARREEGEDDDEDEDDEDDKEESENADDARQETAGPPPSGQAQVETAPQPQPGGDPEGPRRPAAPVVLEGPGTPGGRDEGGGRSETGGIQSSARAHRDTG